jgi:hypothetical protein
LKIESPIERQILDYVARKPAARETMRGIIEWWLLKQSIERTTAEVEAALKKLVAEEKLSAIKGNDGQVYYGHHQANDAKGQEARKLK